MERDNSSGGLDARLGDSLKAWADQGSLSHERRSALRQQVHGLAQSEARHNWVRRTLTATAAAVLVAITILAASPGARAWAAENLPFLGKFLSGYTSQNKGWAWAEEHGMLQQVMAAATDQGYTLRIHSVLADQAQTTIIYSVEGPEPGFPQFNWSGVRFAGRHFPTSAGASGEVIDGVMVGSAEFQALPSGSGMLELTADRIGDVAGKWQVRFRVSRTAIDKLTRTIVVNKQVDVTDGTLTVQSLIVSPAQLKLVAQWVSAQPVTAAEEQAAIESLGASLLAADGSTLARATSVNGRGGRRLDGRLAQTYEAVFDRIDPLPESVTASLSLTVYHPDELRVPLQAGASAAGTGGRKVTIESVDVSGDTGQAVVSIAPSAPPGQRPFGSCSIADDGGGLNSIGGGNLDSPDPGVARMSIQWRVPAGRKSVALVVSGFFETRDIGLVPIDLRP